MASGLPNIPKNLGWDHMVLIDRHTHKHIQTHTQTYTQTHTQAFTNTQMHIYTHTHIHTHTHTHTHTSAPLLSSGQACDCVFYTHT